MARRQTCATVTFNEIGNPSARARASGYPGFQALPSKAWIAAFAAMSAGEVWRKPVTLERFADLVHRSSAIE
jgi:hypothetical protein